MLNQTLSLSSCGSQSPGDIYSGNEARQDLRHELVLVSGGGSEIWGSFPGESGLAYVETSPGLLVSPRAMRAAKHPVLLNPR